MTDILIASHGHFASGLQSSLDILTGMGKQVNVIDAYVDDSDYTPKIEEFIKSAKRPAVIMSVLLDSEPLTKTHLKDLIKQSQVELIELENEKEKKESDNDFFA